VEDVCRREYVVPRPSNGGGPKLDFLSVTPTGREWAAETEPIPEDNEGFLADLESRVPGVAPVLKQYVAEGLTAYSRQTFFAAAVMLGAASEAALYMLADAVVVSHIGSGAERKKPSRTIERHPPHASYFALQAITCSTVSTITRTTPSHGGEPQKAKAAQG
jgi:hypothetical protein